MTIDSLSPLAAGLPEFPSMGESLQFQVVGFMIVMTVLISLWLVIQVVGAVFTRIKNNRPAPKETPADPLPSPGIEAAAPNAETVALITAAVHTVLDGHYRILSISEHFEDKLGAWSAEGRRQIFSSHKVR